MTQRSIFAGTNQTIIIKVGGSVTVKGQEGDRLTAETEGMGRLDRGTAQRIGNWPRPGGGWRACTLRCTFEAAQPYCEGKEMRK